MRLHFDFDMSATLTVLPVPPVLPTFPICIYNIFLIKLHAGLLLCKAMHVATAKKELARIKSDDFAFWENLLKFLMGKTVIFIVSKCRVNNSTIGHYEIDVT
ncbi:hypothetical protein MT325_m765R [Paramecium bursaria chlorella virus MT325]|uniref:Uncharacterized protein m765R n=1 Tax=Paramecium bursaria Chlorella virus MT325 TaxID=346932 RepID=A7IVE5_PBCVM|nr:hypothetical protein MT325_m765R [Paramecium bursaria chlorella virus MT325]